MKKTFCLLLILLIFRICSAQNFLNASLENWASSSVCEINTAPDNWMDYSTGTAGVGPDEVNFSICPTTFPTAASNGIIYSRMYSGSDSTGEGVFQNISGLTIGNNYKITFDYAGTSYLGSSVGQIQFHLFIDDIDVNQTVIFQSTDAVWSAHSFNFIATQSLHKIGIRLFRLSGSASAAIDNFNLSIVTGIENSISHSQILIYPNPSDGIVNLIFQSNITSDVNVEITDVIGRVVYNKKYSSFNGREENIIDVSTFKKGVYLLSLRNSKGVVTKKLVVN